MPDSGVEPTRALVQAATEGAATLSVPLEVEVGTGHSWGVAH